MMILQEDVNEKKPIHYYLAQIALEVRRSYVKKRTGMKLKQFLLSFVTKSPASAMNPKARIQTSKRAWMSVVLGGKKK